MKHTKKYLGITFLFLCCLLGMPLFSQPLAQTDVPIERISRRQCSGTAMPYAYQQRKQSAPPAGYSPFYINHLGRHGARYLSSASKITPVLKILHNAKQQNMLTERGLEIDSFLTELSVQSENKWGKLTALGKEEQRNIARRMITNYPAVFDPIQGDSMTIFSISTSVHRCIESMESFTAELKSLNPSLIIHSESGTKFDSILRFFDCNAAYLVYKERGGWGKVYNPFVQQNTPVTQVQKALFVPGFAVPDNSLIDFSNKLFQIYAILPDMNIEFPMEDIFPIQDARRLWENSNLRQYLLKGPSTIGQGVPVDIAAPLLEDFLITAKQAIETDGICADIRFAHAETLIPFAALLGIPQASARIDNPQQVATSWQDFGIAPMAANIQWIFYRNASNETIVKVLLNEQEVFLPVTSDIQPYYRWDDLYTYYKRMVDALYQKDKIR